MKDTRTEKSVILYYTMTYGSIRTCRTTVVRATISLSLSENGIEPDGESVPLLCYLTVDLRCVLLSVAHRGRSVTGDIQLGWQYCSTMCCTGPGQY